MTIIQDGNFGKSQLEGELIILISSNPIPVKEYFNENRLLQDSK